MNQPTRLLEGDLDDFERALLSSAAGDHGTERARARSLAVFGVLGVELATSTAAASTAATAITPAKGAMSAITSGMLAKWLGTGILLGTVTAGGAYAIQSQTRPVSSPSMAAVDSRASLKASAGATRSSTVTEQRIDTGRSEAREARVERREAELGSVDADPAPTAPVARVGASSGSFPVDSASTLSEELAALERARRALESGDVTGALRELSRYATRFPNGALADESTLLTVEARLDAGDAKGAHAAAARILARDPKSPHAQRLLTLFSNKETR